MSRSEYRDTLPLLPYSYVSSKCHASPAPRPALLLRQRERAQSRRSTEGWVLFPAAELPHPRDGVHTGFVDEHVAISVEVGFAVKPFNQAEREESSFRRGAFEGMFDAQRRANDDHPAIVREQLAHEVVGGG